MSAVHDTMLYGGCLSAAYLQRKRGLRETAAEIAESDIYSRQLPLMLDSGAFQKAGGKFGNSTTDVNWAQILEYADLLDPEFVVVDDVIGNHLRTYRRLKQRSEFLEEYTLVAPIQCVNYRKDRFKEYVSAVVELGYDYVAVPYHVIDEKSADALRTVLEWLNEFAVDIHVLGCPLRPEHLSVCAGRAQSIDSSSHVRSLIQCRESHMMARVRSIADFLNEVEQKAVTRRCRVS